MAKIQTHDDLTPREIDEIEEFFDAPIDDLIKRRGKLMSGTAWQLTKRTDPKADIEKFLDMSLTDIEKALTKKAPKAPADKQRKKKG